MTGEGRLLRALTPYPELQALPGPQLPTGYAGCIWLAAIPPLWFATMEPRLAATDPAPAGAR